MSNKSTSISRQLFWSNTGFLIAAIIFITGLASYYYVKQQNQQISTMIEAITQVIAERSVDFITANQGDIFSRDLSRLAVIPHIDQIYVYTLEEVSQELTIFSRFKKYPNAPGFTISSERIISLNKIEFNGSTIDYTHPIKLNEKIIGYIYVHGDVKSIASSLSQIYILLSSVALVLFILSIYITYRLTSKIRQPFFSMSDSLIEVTQKKNYQLTCPSQNYLEAEILVENINLLYLRTNKLLNKYIANIDNLTKQKIELEDKVTNRTDALKESNKELLSTLEQLHQYQEQLVENEKMASLGDLVAGVAHEINTPIGLGVTASTLMIDKLNNLQEVFEDKTLKPSYLNKYIEESKENLQIVYRNLDRAANLVSSFKQMAIDQSIEEAREFNVKQLIDDVFLTLTPKIKHQAYQLLLTCDKDLVIRSKPSPISQILINLIINSFIHGFENSSDAKVTLTIRASNQRLSITYSDNGSGIPNEMQDKIFEPFSTTKRGEGGSGLGMHLVYNLVTQALKGTIQLDADRNNGATFIIDFPVEILTTKD